MSRMRVNGNLTYTVVAFIIVKSKNKGALFGKQPPLKKHPSKNPTLIRGEAEGPRFYRRRFNTDGLYDKGALFGKQPP